MTPTELITALQTGNLPTDDTIELETDEFRFVEMMLMDALDGNPVETREVHFTGSNTGSIRMIEVGPLRIVAHFFDGT